MRDLGSGSAVLADANRKPCGEDVFGCVQVTVVACSAVRVAMPPVFGFGECVVFRAFVVVVHGVLLF